MRTLTRSVYTPMWYRKLNYILNNPVGSWRYGPHKLRGNGGRVSNRSKNKFLQMKYARIFK